MKVQKRLSAAKQARVEIVDSFLSYGFRFIKTNVVFLLSIVPNGPNRSPLSAETHSTPVISQFQDLFSKPVFVNEPTQFSPLLT